MIAILGAVSIVCLLTFRVEVHIRFCENVCWLKLEILYLETLRHCVFILGEGEFIHLFHIAEVGDGVALLWLLKSWFPREEG